MNDDDLEQRLRAHYRSIEPRVTPSRLGARVDDAIERRATRPMPWMRLRPALASLAAALVVVAAGLGIGLRPGGFLVPAGASPAPSLVSMGPTTSSPTPVVTASPSTDPAGVDAAGTFAGGGLWAIRASTLLTSTDAGTTWRTGAVPEGTLPIDQGANPIRVAFVLDADHAWVITAGSGSTAFTGAATDALHLVIGRTTDGGRTWESTVVPGSYAGTSQSIVFVDPLHGYVLNSALRGSQSPGAILRTADGGATWQVTGAGPTWTADGGNSWLGSMFAASDASTLWAGAEQEAGPVQHPLLDVSRDGGRTWRDARLPGLEGQLGGAAGAWLPQPPVFTDASTGLVTIVSSSTRIYRTTDGGRSWTLVADRPVEASAGLAVLGPTHWLLPTENPLGLEATADGGRTWQAVASDGLPNGGWIVSIGALDASHAMAIVPTGHSYPGSAALVVTADGGRTWTPAKVVATP